MQKITRALGMRLEVGTGAGRRKKKTPNSETLAAMKEAEEIIRERHRR